MATKRAKPKARAAFIETIDCLPVSTVPEGPEWTYEIKLDGYRLEAVKSKGRPQVYDFG
jgi:ATP-dependent DNA ligase